MSRFSLSLTASLHQYIVEVGTRESPEQIALREQTANHPWAGMQISPEQGQFLQLLVQILGAKKIMELGVFTGYSSMSMALALPADGKLIACDVNEEYTNTAKIFWAKAEIQSKIDLVLAPALHTMQTQLDDGAAATFDLIFADAVKEEYQDYYELGLQLLRPGGVMATDNTLWNGDVVNPENQTDETKAIRAFNSHVHQDNRVDMVLLPIGDGLTLARKR
ncbi:MAG: class I SAM-dependent methyltransferase [Pseudomonadota bacterium]